jgi:hypothetical protein
MLFVYAPIPHARKHGPSGYAVYVNFKPWLRDEFHFRCAYCLERERWDRSGHAAFGIDHVKPKGTAEFAHLILNYENLVYACNRCNSWKREAIVLDPCSATLADHIRMDADGTMLGLSQGGTRLIEALGLNDHVPLSTRRRFMRLLRLFQDHPEDAEIRALFVDFFGYPDDLPDLDRLRPRENSRPA